jgi:hypothetical protein
LLFTFSLEYAIMELQENQERLNLKAKPVYLVCMVIVSLLDGNVNTINKTKLY